MAIPNSEYWAKRFARLEEISHKHGKRWIKETEIEFIKARETIKDRVSRFYHQFEELTGFNYTEARKALDKGELSAFKLTVDEYIRLGESLDVHFDPDVLKELKTASLRVRISRLEAIQCFIDAEIARLYGGLNQTIWDYLGETYENRYYQTAHELSGLGFSFNVLNKKQIDTALKRPWSTSHFSETIWKNQKSLQENLNKIITQSTILGRSWTETGVLLNKQMGTGSYNCARIISTEMSALASEAQTDMFNEMGLKEYEIVATLDTHTSQICQSMDGKVFKMSERKVGETAPPFHPQCRTTTCPHFADIRSSTRIARKSDDSKNEYVPNTTYREWAKKNNIKPIYGLWDE